MLLAAVLLLPQAALAQARYIRGIRVTVAPPPLRYEVPPPAPSVRHQWIAGYWAWRAGAQAWIPGRWALPPVVNYVWEPARWERQESAWTFCDGHWRPSEQPDPVIAYQPPPPPVQDVVVEAPPPAPLEEVRPVEPFPGAFWIPGYWHWNGGRHEWVTGRWSARPAGFGWRENHWDRRDDGRWVHRPGHWEHHDDHDDDERRERHEEHRDRR
jgi:hypothetical protein